MIEQRSNKQTNVSCSSRRKRIPPLTICILYIRNFRNYFFVIKRIEKYIVHIVRQWNNCLNIPVCAHFSYFFCFLSFIQLVQESMKTIDVILSLRYNLQEGTLLLQYYLIFFVISFAQIHENMKAIDVIPLLTPVVMEKIEAVVQSKPKRPDSYR